MLPGVDTVGVCADDIDDYQGQTGSLCEAAGTVRRHSPLCVVETADRCEREHTHRRPVHKHMYVGSK